MVASTPPPPKVCVIGGGPGAMFFCHGLEAKKREMQEDDPGHSKLPIVTCFERAPAPGGVWRSERTFGNVSLHRGEEKKEPEVAAPTTNMYEALWTNGPKENIEFFDYTFQEHFGDHPLPVYMPRQPILDYMIGRVTKNCPDFFDKYMNFNTSVESVRYIESKSKFEVVTRDMCTGIESKRDDFDYCVWSGGENGKPMIPKPLLNLLHAGGFDGRIIHSTDTANFEKDVKNKRVLIIGGSYSAEDLALMAIKVGAEKIFISSRCKENAVHWTKSWPENKVQVLDEQTPIGVTENGRCIQFANTEWVFPGKYVPSKNVETEIRDIDTIIFCTGYLPNTSILDKDLREALRYADMEMKLPVPKDWKMTPNKFTEAVGDVEPGDVRWIEGPVSYPALYRGFSINNPRMMFITANVDNPMTGVDVCSRLLLQYIVGECKVPSKEEMVRQNEQDALIMMQNPWWRYCMDKNYHDAVNASFDPKSLEEMIEVFRRTDSGYDIYARYLARAAREAVYPVDFGTLEELNETALKILEYDELSYEHRTELTAQDAEERRTFRDYKDADKFRSLFTGAKSVPLKQMWLDTDANDPSILES